MIVNGGVVYKTGCMNSVVSLDVHVSCVIIQKKSFTTEFFQHV